MKITGIIGTSREDIADQARQAYGPPRGGRDLVVHVTEMKPYGFYLTGKWLGTVLTQETAQAELTLGEQLGEAFRYYRDET
jgi:hypothetical protein